jgi:hypothetical protein
LDSFPLPKVVVEHGCKRQCIRQEEGVRQLLDEVEQLVTPLPSPVWIAQQPQGHGQMGEAH